MTDETLENIIGLTLDKAREWLQADESLRALPLEIIETAPPLRPASTLAAKKKGDASTRTPRRETNFGAFRVLRARCENASLELTVARGILRDEHDSNGL